MQGASSTGGATTAAGEAVTSSTGVTRTTPASGVPAHASGTGAPNPNSGVPYEIRTVSMTPTYKPETTAYYDPTRTQPRVGDVIVFRLPTGGCGAIQVGGETCRVPAPGIGRTLSIKRVVGLPGDTIAIRGGHLIRNGRPEPEPPTVACREEAGCQFPKAITVPAGHYFVMSDYRPLYQDDSRAFGPIPRTSIMGTVEGG